MIRLLALFLTLALAAPAAADIYRYRGADGTVCFTDTPRRPGDRPVISVPRRPDPSAPRDLSHGPRFNATVSRAATDTGLAADLLHAVIATESGYDPHAVSPKGAMGLMQLMPATARDLGVADPYDPEENVRGGARYLRTLYDRFGDLTLALAAYHAGPDRVVQYGGVPPFAETRTYLDRLRACYPEGKWQQPEARASQPEVKRHPASPPRSRIYRVRLASGEILYTNIAR